MDNLTGRNVGKTCRTHYRGTFNDGTQFDSSYDRGEPLEFVCGAGQMIKGYDAAVADMEVGEVKEIHLMPEEAYGMPNPDAIFGALSTPIAISADCLSRDTITAQVLPSKPFSEES